jgi:SAM-dependent methyltransferase
MPDSYTSDGQNVFDHLRQIFSLRKVYSEEFQSRIAGALREIKETEARIWDHYQIQLTNLDVLELGPGQFLGQLPYLLSRNNRVAAADRDLIAQGIGLAQYIRMLQSNGLVRTFKTLGRKALGVDRRYRQELCRSLGLRTLPSFEVKQADARSLPFGDKSFDLVYSRAVFQHLPAPSDAIKEISRVLKPGGIAYISLQPYTSRTACLDPRVLYGGAGDDFALWPHLRPELKDKVKPNACLNRLGLPEWRRIFTADTRDPVFIVTPVDDRYAALAAALKEAGHLREYSMEELTAGALDVMFRMPDKQ